MNAPDPPPPGDEHDRPKSPQPFSQEVRHTSLSAQVPESVSRGLLSTGVMVLHTQQEFVLDFVVSISRPHQIVSRVVLTPQTVSQFISALRENVRKYEEQFGTLEMRAPLGSSGKAAPQSKAEGGTLTTAGDAPAEPSKSKQSAAQPSANAEDIYDQLKLPDEILGGNYANVVMIRHTTEEFCLEFIAKFYPRSIVVSRLYLAAGRVPSLIAALTSSLEKFRRQSERPPEPPPSDADDR